jgi:hypothetical protein
MKHLKVILTIKFLLCFLTIYASKDRIERPNIYKFIFQNNDSIRLIKPTDSILNIYSNYIIGNTIQLIEAELSFETGEILTIRKKENKWTMIKITDEKKEFIIPEETLQKISAIHFSTIALLWDGGDQKALTASYFYISFETGTNKSFGKYPQLQLMFSGGKFSKSTIFRKISEISSKYIDL